MSGEGATDIGTSVPLSGGGGAGFVPGPMAWFVDKLLEPRLGFSPLEVEGIVRHVSEGEIAARTRSDPLVLPGKKGPKGYAGYVKAAQALGSIAREDALAANDPCVMAVLFRDSDGTNAASGQHWQQVVDAIRAGFERVECASGVPMVPRPKSEAWLMCGLKEHAYQHCDSLEDAPGNDRSPNSLKSRLCELIGHDPTAEEQAAWVRDGTIDPLRIAMPSFSAFSQALHEAGTRAGLPNHEQQD